MVFIINPYRFTPPVFTATGGNQVFTEGIYKYHVFTASGTLTVSSGSKSAEFYIIGGGGSGGGFSANGNGGGGGAGGIYNISGLTLTTGTYSVTVGSGGAASSNDGAESHFALSNIGAGGGGKGGNFDVAGGNAPVFVLVSSGVGGSGGGAGETPAPGNTRPGGLGYAGGNDGAASTDLRGGGGGGHGASATDGTGGAGVTVTTWYRSAGNTVGTVAVGGNASSVGGSATANTGNGSNGGGSSNTGGSGLVIVRYLA